MKKVLSTLAIMLFGFTAVANNYSTPLASHIKAGEEDKHQLVIEIGSQDKNQKFEFGFITWEALQNFDLNALSDRIVIFGDSDELCEVSITVKVRVGIDSNFVEASATMSGIPCNGVIKAIKGLKAQLLAGIQ